MEEAGYMFLKRHRKGHELLIKRVTDFTVRAAGMLPHGRPTETGRNFLPRHCRA